MKKISYILTITIALLSTMSCEDIVEGINDNPNDIIISDVEMPGMDGLELLDRVKAKSPKKIFIVMSADPSYEKRAKELGADAFLAKPFSIEDLFSLVELYIAGKH